MSWQCFVTSHGRKYLLEDFVDEPVLEVVFIPTEDLHSLQNHLFHFAGFNIDIASPFVLSFLLESLYPLLIQLSILRAGQYFPTLPSQHCKRISPRATLTCYTNTEETGPLLPLTPIPTNISSHPYQQFFSFFSKVAPFFSSWLNWKKSKICTNIVSCQF